MTIVLNARPTAEAALKAYEERRLSAQNDTPACLYRDASGHPCAIGAALTDEQAASFDRPGQTVQDLYACFRIQTDDIDALQEMQSTHDCWANRAGCRYIWNEQEITEAELKFVATLKRYLV